MSRTDKDLPYWYDTKYEARHMCRQFGHARAWQTLADECDLPEFSYANILDDKNQRWRKYDCSWMPIRRRDFRHWYDKNPSWWMSMVWTHPTRRMVRDLSTKALQDYNANGDTDVDIPNFRRKHEGGWYW